MAKELRKVRKRLVSRAIDLASQGYSVIPVQGDAGAGEPKKPSIKWRAYQKRIADASELEAMFDRRAGGLAVVCGQISQLLVIDFDDHVRYRRFCRQLPQLAETYTVKTRRGYHVYFRTTEKVPTHQFEGGDIKGEKSYVVAAPSVIGGFEYKPVTRRPVAVLEKAGVDAILNYFHVRLSVRLTPQQQSAGARDVDIGSLYRRLSRAIGRNNALYRCASVGGSQGMSGGDLEALLLKEHLVAAGPAGHKFETVADRMREARQTIVSALRRIGQVVSGDEGIPNTVRERLLQAQGSAVTARLLDIMSHAKWAAESFFSMSDAIRLCKEYGVNRKSVMAALTGEHSLFNGRHIISRRYVEYLDIAGLNSGRRGRRVQLVFQMPAVSRLLSVLGVNWSPSDRLSKIDLGSSQAYRRALHREYVKRLSPRVPLAVMAGRLGLNARTLRRYNAQLGVRVCERVGRFALSWETLKCLPRRERGQSKNETSGYWLEVGESARFPAWRHVGAALLRVGAGAVQVCMRRASILSLAKGGGKSLVYESLSPEEFVRIRVGRGDGAGHAGLLDRLRALASEFTSRVARARYDKVRLRFDSVATHIADDKVAASIEGYLWAQDGSGAEVRRPARRGIAYRMLKEFGEGNVYLSLRDSYSELLGTMARHAFRVGDESAGAGLLARSMA